jgi:two-component system chemotaxis response regulator CheY
MGKKKMLEVNADQKTTADDAHALQNKPRAQKILLADDDLYIRSLIKKIVVNHVEIQVMTDGQGVVDQYRLYRHAMVLLDIHLPSKTGFKIAQEILEYDPEAHIVMLSSDSTRENVLRTKKIGAKSFIGKPFHKIKLMHLIDECPYLRYRSYKY